jgi:predicted nucleic acid-binding protein
LKILLDASSVIDLINGQILGVILELPDHEFVIGPQALGECSKRHPEIDQAIADGRILLAADEQIPAQRFIELLSELELGFGETECMVLSEFCEEYVICCDDKRARAVGTTKFGSGRVTGTIALIRKCVSAGLLTKLSARQTVEMMKVMGGYLPEIPDDFFD